MKTWQMIAILQLLDVNADVRVGHFVENDYTCRDEWEEHTPSVLVRDGEALIIHGVDMPAYEPHASWSFHIYQKPDGALNEDLPNPYQIGRVRYLDSGEDIYLDVAYIAEFPRDKDGKCAFCHGGDWNDPETLIGRFFKLHPSAVTCPCCEGRAS